MYKKVWTPSTKSWDDVSHLQPDSLFVSIKKEGLYLNKSLYKITSDVVRNKEEGWTSVSWVVEDPHKVSCVLSIAFYANGSSTIFIIYQNYAMVYELSPAQKKRGIQLNQM